MVPGFQEASLSENAYKSSHFSNWYQQPERSISGLSYTHTSTFFPTVYADRNLGLTEKRYRLLSTEILDWLFVSQARHVTEVRRGKQYPG